MFTIDDLYSSILPEIPGISWDVGTVLTAILLMFILCVALDYIKDIILNKLFIQRAERKDYNDLNKSYDKYGKKKNGGKSFDVFFEERVYEKRLSNAVNYTADKKTRIMKNRKTKK